MNNGGQAFPSSFEQADPRNPGWTGHGMTLRDYFAIHASNEDIEIMVKSLKEEYGNKCSVLRSKVRYLIADDMIAERSKDEKA